MRNSAIELPRWRGDTLHIAVVSDLHVGAPYVGVEKLERVIDEIHRAHPDVVVLLARKALLTRGASSHQS